MAAMNIQYRSVKHPYISHFPLTFGSSSMNAHPDASISYLAVMMTALISNTVPDADTVKLCSM